LNLLAGFLLICSQRDDVLPDPVVEASTGADVLFDPGGEHRPLLLPADEALTYQASIQIAFVRATVGKVRLSSEREPYRASVLLPGAEKQDDLHQVVIALRARGDYSFYSIDSTIETRILPQAWPRILHRVVNEGTEKRSREMMLGQRSDSFESSYRRDTDKGAPKGTRIWKEAKVRPVPQGTIDLLTAVYHTRSLVREGLDALTFPLLDKDRLWAMTLRRGEQRSMETPAGTFDVVEVSLFPQAFPGEAISKKQVEKFEGLLGLRGSIHLWVESRTGIPVRIEGDLPVGPLTLGVDVKLESYAGTPADFRPNPAPRPK
jgi:hypothetical protein